MRKESELRVVEGVKGEEIYADSHGFLDHKDPVLQLQWSWSVNLKGDAKFSDRQDAESPPR